jgi:hypothetical protein
MRYIVTLFLALLMVSPVPAAAQTANNLIYGDQALTVDLEPAYPAPGETFTAKANDYALPIQGAGLRWIIDGKVAPQYDNLRSLSLIAKGAGEKTTIELVIDLPGGSNVRTTKVITPVYLDIIIEPQTRTPAFYRGRALPSIGSTVNATALVDSDSVLPSNLIYTWRLNNETLEGGSVRGNNTVTFLMPRGQFATLSLEVRRPDGTTIARRIFDLPSVTPHLSFYEVSPLYGLTTKSIPETLPLVGAGLAVRAEPYYLDLLTYNNPDFLEWQIDNVRSQNPNSNPYEVTIAGSGMSGASQIEFHVRNTTQVLQGAQGGFRLTY